MRQWMDRWSLKQTGWCFSSDERQWMDRSNTWWYNSDVSPPLISLFCTLLTAVLWIPSSQSSNSRITPLLSLHHPHTHTLCCTVYLSHTHCVALFTSHTHTVFLFTSHTHMLCCTVYLSHTHCVFVYLSHTHCVALFTSTTHTLCCTVYLSHTHLCCTVYLSHTHAVLHCLPLTHMLCCIVYLHHTHTVLHCLPLLLWTLVGRWPYLCNATALMWVRLQL